MQRNISVVKFGLIGTGDAASRLLGPAIRNVPDALLWSVCSRNAQRGMDIAARFDAQGPSPVYTSLDAMLADPGVNAVIIATPDQLHAEQAVKAANAGKHVFVEKPMATDITDASAMIRACEQNGVQLAVGYHHRWHAGHRALKQRIDHGHLNPIHHLSIQWSRPGKMELRPQDLWRAEGSAGKWWSLAALGTHCLDTALWLLKDACGMVERVSAFSSSTRFPGKRDNTDVVTLQFANGVTASVISSIALAETKRIELFYGDGGRTVCTDTFGPFGSGSVTLDGKEVAFAPSNPYVVQLTDFVQAVRLGRDPEVDGYAGLDNVTLLSAIDDSIRRK